ncbi:MAG: hypothetical protein QM770_01955 [Tepidisphaeraceae bacterium]
MRTWHRRIALLTLACTLGSSGCIPINARSGTDLSSLDGRFTIEANKTTEKELLARFGPPTNSTLGADGSKQLLWADNRGSSHVNVAAAIVPFGFLADRQGTKMTSRTLMVTIRNGLVVDYHLSDGAQQF